jgi:hypothetical protein
MNFIQNFYTSRDNNTDGNTYVGQQDRLWWNPNTNAIYVNSANVAGGTPVTLPATANLTINSLTANTATINTNLVVTGNISPAANNKIGGIAPGPGINISNIGLLTIDSAGLPVSFGDFYANVNQLSMVNANEAMYLVSNGTGNINLIGGVNFYKPNGFPPSTEPFFRAKSDGQLRILVPAEDPFEGGVEIIGSSTGNYLAPGSPGTMLHLTGNPGVPTRLYIDGNAEYASFVARRFNGNVAVPTQVLAGQDVLRINSTAATNLGGGNVGNVAMAQIRTTALENQTSTAQGSSITFTVTPIGSAASARVDVANVTVANGITATKFTTTGNISGGNLNLSGNITADYVQANNFGNVGNVEIEAGETYWYFNTDNTFTGNGNIIVDTVTANLIGTATTATNLAAATSILAGTLTIDPANINKTSASTQTFTLTGLTTSHKIVITSGTALTYGVVIAAAWASAADTISIEFQNYTGGGVNLGSTNIQYFAWV